MRYIFRKMQNLFPYYFPSFVLAFVLRHIILYGYSWPLHVVLKDLLYSIWEILGVSMAGFLSFWNGPTWYISAMLLAMLVIYPILRRHFELFTHLIAPGIAIFIMGYVYTRYGSLKLDGAVSWFRTVMELSMGAYSYSVCEKIAALNFTRCGKVCLAFVEVTCYGLSVLFMCIRDRSKLDFIVLMLLLLAVTISFSEKSCLADLLQKFDTSKLAEFSMAFFLTHISWAKLLCVKMAGKGYYHMLLCYMICAVVSTILLMLLVRIYRKYRPYLVKKLWGILFAS